MLAGVDWASTSAGGVEFLTNARPPWPIMMVRLDAAQSTRIWWSDGFQEFLDDLELRPREGHNNAPDVKRRHNSYSAKVEIP